jgi:hypothetical protein
MPRTLGLALSGGARLAFVFAGRMSVSGAPDACANCEPTTAFTLVGVVALSVRFGPCSVWWPSRPARRSSVRSRRAVPPTPRTISRRPTSCRCVETSPQSRSSSGPCPCSSTDPASSASPPACTAYGAESKVCGKPSLPPAARRWPGEPQRKPAEARGANPQPTWPDLRQIRASPSADRAVSGG